MYQAVVTEKLPYGLINIRAGGHVRGYLDEILGLSLPRTPNTTAENDKITALWLGPDEWLARTADGDEFALAAELRSCTRGEHVGITKISDSYVVHQVSGRDSRAVLGQGTGIDLHPGQFPPGRCARTVFGKTTVVLHHFNEGCYDIYAWRSYGHYVQAYLRKCVGY